MSILAIVAVIVLALIQFRYSRKSSAAVRLLWVDNATSQWKDRFTLFQKGAEIEPTVGAIQFLQPGYSLELERVDYGSNGLSLNGHLGNHTLLWLSSLTLNFGARKQLSDKELSPEDPASSWLGPDVIGTGQASPIATLGPGMRASFAVTIPNVSQKERATLIVWFSGERYQYPTTGQ
ncbi:MAG TPA: hypothetical protein VN999_18000 [Thermoanaerobaculia bacterium]|nr:hypothetical protein [Thermoanaerobaculia bacterium]